MTDTDPWLDAEHDDRAGVSDPPAPIAGAARDPATVRAAHLRTASGRRYGAGLRQPIDAPLVCRGRDADIAVAAHSSLDT